MELGVIVCFQTSPHTQEKGMYYVDIITSSWFCKLSNQMMICIIIGIGVQDQKKTTLQYPRTLSLLRVGSGDKEELKGYTMYSVFSEILYESHAWTLHRMGMSHETQHGTHTPIKVLAAP